MPEKFTPLARLCCLLLAGLLCYRVAKVAIHKDPFQGVKVPAILKSDAFFSSASPASTNSLSKTNTTNRVAVALTNAPGTLTNRSAALTNAAPLTNALAQSTNSIGTNQAAPARTNATASRVAGGPALPPGATSRRPGGPGMPFPMGMPGMPGPGGQPPGPPLPQPIQARVDKIIQSEILGTIMRPMPMALIGIAGKDAMIRTPTGQTSLMREGEEAGGIKLLKIGTNRILIEHENEKKELTLFSGFGSQSLLAKEKDSPK